jgi:predicted nucleotidyltransferase
MIYHQPLDGLLGSRSKVTLLRLLVRTRAEQTGSEWARQVGLDVKTCHTALQELAEQGVVLSRKVATAILYRLNAGHFLAETVLIPLFEREEQGLVQYAKDLRSEVGLPIVSLILFGSVARKEERATSDVDLILIVKSPAMRGKAEDHVDQAATDLASRYGNPPQVIVIDRESFRRKAQKGDALITEVLRTGRVLSGRPFSEILKHVS